MFFITTLFQKDWIVNFFVKRHDLSGVIDLVSTRGGMGVALISDIIRDISNYTKVDFCEKLTRNDEAKM
jgi:hypothetical protein